MSLFLIQVKQAPSIFHELTQMTLAYQEKNALQHFFCQDSSRENSM